MRNARCQRVRMRLRAANSFWVSNQRTSDVCTSLSRREISEATAPARGDALVSAGRSDCNIGARASIWAARSRWSWESFSSRTTCAGEIWPHCRAAKKQASAQSPQRMTALIRLILLTPAA